MAYARTVKGAKIRVALKRKLRAKNIKGWKNNSTTKLLKAKLKKK